MATIQRIHLGPESSPLQQGRGSHGRWRLAYQQAGTEPETGQPIPVSFTFAQDADRLAFALAEGPAAEVLAQQMGDYLWTRDSANGDWPMNLREWLADTARWTAAPPGRTTFICGRLERNVAGGRVYLAWLGMSGVRLLDRSEGAVTLDTIIGEDEGWTPAHGPEPVGMGLHAYRGSLFSLDRLEILSTAAAPLRDDLPDMGARDVQQALEDWGQESDRALVVFDLRLNQVLSRPNTVTLNYRWIAPDLCLLSWHPSPNVTGYRLEEAASSAFEDPVLVAELTDGRQVQYRLSPPSGSLRYYRVIPLNQGVPGAPSEPVCPMPMILPAPILEPIKWSADGGYYLRWTSIAQATSYEVQRSTDVDFDASASEVVYRGDVAEVYLPPETLPNQFYRVRAINVLYAPNNPSHWSQPHRSPARLDTPTFTRVTQKRIEWTPVSGARQYMVWVAVPGQDEAQGEEIYVADPMCGVADQPATYRVRALRRPDDLRTISEWSEVITVSPPKSDQGPRRSDLRPMLPLLIGAALVALLVGAGLGLGALRAYQEANATSTATPLPATAIQATNVAATFNAMNATSVDRLETQVKQTAVSFRDQTATATQWTLTPTPTATFTPSHTPNLTETIELAFQAGQTATAAGWTFTPTPTATFTPSITPNLTETIEIAFQAGQTATAVGWTLTPTPSATFTPSNTPNLTQTIESAFKAGQTATAAGWTLTPTPTATFTPSVTPNLTATMKQIFQDHQTAIAAGWTLTPTASRTPTPLPTLPPSLTPNFTATLDAAVQAHMTAIAAGWTATPLPTITPLPSATPDATATAEAIIFDHLSAGCFVINLPNRELPVYPIPKEVEPPLLPAVPRLAAITHRLEIPTGSAIIWLQVRVRADGGELIGWVRVPDDVPESELYAGHNCPSGRP